MISCKIAPSIICSDLSKLSKQVLELEEAGADIIHVDVMDGHFVPAFGLSPTTIMHIRSCTKLPIEAHLMIENVEHYIDSFIQCGSSIISFHAEICKSPFIQIRRIKSAGLKASIVLNPSTQLHYIEYLMEELDMVVLLAVDPGFRGQPFIPSILKKIERLRDMSRNMDTNIDIEIDGGIRYHIIPKVVQAGANILVGGSIIFNARSSISDSIRKIKLLCNNVEKCTV